MDKLTEAKSILNNVGMPIKQQSDICGYVLLAMSGIKEKSSWQEATNKWIGIHEMIQFIKNEYGIQYAENSRETFRKQAIHHFRNAALIEDNGKSTNSPLYKYRITDETLNMIRNMNTEAWYNSISNFTSIHESLKEKYASKKRVEKMPVEINGKKLTFSPGKHNELQKAILEEFAPRFAPNSVCLYVGDTIEKDLVKETELLKSIGLDISVHDKMPDVVLYRKDKNWIYFIEAVTSVGPISPKRILEITDMTHKMTAKPIFITAFPNMKVFKKFAEELAWETEVWLSEMPDHMIHLNGDKFMGPRS